MKTLLKVLLPSLLILAACQDKKSPEMEKLLVKRDSLIEKEYEIRQQMNDVDEQIALLKAGNKEDDKKIIKKIASQKNKIAAIEKKIRELEGELSPDTKDDRTIVAVKEIKPQEFDHYIKLFGKVEAENYANISPEIGGRIDAIHVNEGQRVNKGDLLVSLNTQAIEKQIESIGSTLDLATTTYNKQKTLWDQGIGSEIQYLGAKKNKESLEAQLEALRAQKRMAQIRAPFNGLVNKIYSKKGELAAPGLPVVEFVNLKDIIIRADVPEEYITDVKKGQDVSLSFASLKGVKIKTPIQRVSEVIDAKTRTFEIELKVKNSNGRIKPNMVSTIEINDYHTDNGFVVPSLVIRKDFVGNYNYVYVVADEDGQDIIRKKTVEREISYNDQTSIKSGLSEGDRVVVSGYHLVSSGVPVKIANNTPKTR